MADLPLAEQLIGSSVTEQQFKTALKNLIDNLISKDHVQLKKYINTHNVDLNTLTDEAVYHITTSGYAQSLINRPVELINGGIIIVKNTEGVVAHQSIITRNGIFNRWGTLTEGAWGFNEWVGIKFNNQSILDVDQIAKEKAQNEFSIAEQKFEIKSSLDVGGNLDDLSTSGVYHIPSTGVMASLIGKPSEALNGGVLFVRNSVSYGTTHQIVICPQGLFSRFKTANGWQPWVYTPNMEAVNNAISQAMNNIISDSKRNEITSFGSSTLWYLGDELQRMANHYGRKFNNCGVSGETVQGAMLSQGSLKMRGVFPDGYLRTSGTFKFVAEFDGLEPTYMHHNLMLDNGVLCRFVKPENAAVGVYDVTPLNNTTDLDVSDITFNVWNPTFNNLEETIHIINVGKNNINSSATALEIYDMTVQMIEHIKTPRRFVVAGHFSNHGESDTHIAKVELVNRLLWAKYNKFYVDLNGLLFSDSTWTTLGLTKTQADIEAIEKRTLPPSLSRDSAHLSAGMDQVFADAIERKLIDLGYL